MKRLILIILLVYGYYGYAQTITQEGLDNNTRYEILKEIYSDGDSAQTDAETPFYNPFLREDLLSFVKVMLVEDERIDSIRIDDSKVTIWGNYCKGFAREGGYENIYLQYHDIYSSLFNFQQIDKISVYDCWEDCRNITYLPMKTDEPLIVMQDAEFYRELYISGMDYYEVIGEDSFLKKSSTTKRMNS